MNKKEAAIVAAFTGRLIGKFSDMHEYIEQIMGRPVFTHEFADEETMAEIKRAAKDDFIILSESITPEIEHE